MGPTRTEDVKLFLRTLFGSCEDGWVNLFMQESTPPDSLEKARTHPPVWRHVTEAEQLANFIGANRKTRDIWVSCCPRRERLPSPRRGCIHDVQRVAGSIKKSTVHK